MLNWECEIGEKQRVMIRWIWIRRRDRRRRRRRNWD